ncbi:DUF4398 domain-containing protein [Rhodanobacter sp. Col0626]|uniref:DUF4398 domain-containing protein n=1 Tax=Rhodanobacter sp. Col0626 TaxID=3415679 RepID=UPI003CE8E812
MHIFSPLAEPLGRARTAATFLALAMTLALTGCATVPPPNDSMNMAQTQLQEAREAGAGDYAPVDLGFAQDKFQQAQSAMASRKYVVAADLAEESRADAELARAKARLGAARAQIQSKLQENTSLRSQGEQTEAAGQAPDEQPSASPAAPAQDMPAPSSSALSAPTEDGFQTVPDAVQPSDANPQGGQP